MKELGQLLLLVALCLGPWVLVDFGWRLRCRKLPKAHPAARSATTPAEAREPPPPPEPPESPNPAPPVAEAADPRAILEEWSLRVTKDVLERVGEGKRVAGRPFERPPAATTAPGKGTVQLLFLLRVPVAGLAYHAYAEEAHRIATATELVLAREPANPYDPLAIAIHGPGGRRLGYVPRRQNAVLARLMDGGLPIRAFVMRHVADHDAPVVEVAIALAGVRREKGVAA